jgi:hypothetical protein
MIAPSHPSQPPRGLLAEEDSASGAALRRIFSLQTKKGTAEAVPILPDASSSELQYQFRVLQLRIGKSEYEELIRIGVAARGGTEVRKEVIVVRQPERVQFHAG